MIAAGRRVSYVMHHPFTDLWIVLEDAREGFFPWLGRQQIVLTQGNVEARIE